MESPETLPRRRPARGASLCRAASPEPPGRRAAAASTGALGEQALDIYDNNSQPWLMPMIRSIPAKQAATWSAMQDRVITYLLELSG